MKLNEVQQLLKENNYQYEVSVIPNRAEFYRQKGFHATEDTSAFLLLTITNPNHKINIEIVFDGDSDVAEFYDLEFGGYWYGMFGYLDEELPHMLLEEIQNITDGKSYVIFAANAKTRKWFYSGLFCDTPEEEWNEMDQFRKAVEKIKAPKSLWRKLIRRTDIYEIFNWQHYENVVK